MEDLIISLDIGTTMVKSVIFNTKGEEVSIVEKCCKTISPSMGYVEQDPEGLWAIVIEVLKCAAQTIKNNQRIQAIAIATQGGSVVPVNNDGQAVYNIITWMDSRAANLVAEWIKNGTAGRIRSISGWNPQPGLPLPVIAWLHKHKPDLCNQTRYWLSINDFIAFKLTSTYATNPSMAGEMLLTDIQTGYWDEELCHLAGIETGQLSNISPSDTIIGKINKTSSLSTGLAEGIPVINGGQDHACEAMALGIADYDTAFLACGTAWVINAMTNSDSVIHIPDKMDLNFHVLPNLWITSQFLGNLGSYPEWCVNQFWDPGENKISGVNRFKLMDESLKGLRAVDEDLIFLPFRGSQFSRQSLNSGGFFGLRLNHSISDLCHAVLESAAYEVHWALQDLEKETANIQELWMIGGASRSPVWPQILADINGIDILTTSYTHGPALGAAILAWLGLGIYDNIEECSKIITLNKRSFHPDPDKKEIYKHKFSANKNIIKKYNSLTV